MNRRGVTVAELLVALVVMAFLGIALTRILISDSRFVSKQDAMLAARQAARSAMNTVAGELRMVGDSGVTAATPKQVSVRIPYAFGVLCQTSGPDRVAVVLPTDSVAYASAVPGGMAWRDSTGNYRLVNGVAVTTSANTGACVGDSIRVGIPGSKLIAINPLTAAAAPGDLFYLYESITYRFATSLALPGRVALLRQSGSAPDEELVAPFDTSAGFAFLTGPTLKRVNAVPPLDSIRGLELKLVAASEYAPQGSSKPQKFDLRTRIAFLNKQ